MAQDSILSRFLGVFRWDSIASRLSRDFGSFGFIISALAHAVLLALVAWSMMNTRLTPGDSSSLQHPGSKVDRPLVFKIVDYQKEIVSSHRRRVIASTSRNDEPFKHESRSILGVQKSLRSRVPAKPGAKPDFFGLTGHQVISALAEHSSHGERNSLSGSDRAGVVEILKHFRASVPDEFGSFTAAFSLIDNDDTFCYISSPSVSDLVKRQGCESLANSSLQRALFPHGLDRHRYVFETLDWTPFLFTLSSGSLVITIDMKGVMTINGSDITPPPRASLGGKVPDFDPVDLQSGADASILTNTVSLY